MRGWTAVLIGAAVGCASPPMNVQLATPLPPSYGIELVEVAEPAEVVLVTRDPLLPPMALPRGPEEPGRKWVALRLRVAPPPLPPGVHPSERGGFALEKIQLIAANGEAMSVRALASGGEWRDEKSDKLVAEFVAPGRSESIFKDASGRFLMTTSAGMLTFWGTGPRDVGLLFAVPLRVRDARLRL